MQARIPLQQLFHQLGSNNILDERTSGGFFGGFFSAAAAHDAAKINSSQGIDVRLARTGGQLGARCVERKQAPPQDAASTQLRPGTCVSLSFGASTAFTHACFAMLLMTAIVVALQSQHPLTSRSLAATTQRCSRVTLAMSYLGRCFGRKGVGVLHLHAGLFFFCHRVLVLLLEK